MASNKVRRCGENNSSDLFLLHGSGDPSKTKVNRLRKTKSSSILYIIYFCLRQSISTIFTVGEAVRSTCGKSEEKEEKEEEDRFLQNEKISNSKYDHIMPTGGT